MDIFNLNELVIAYRKAKVDVYYMGGHSALDILEYEENLTENLQKLSLKLQNSDLNWLQDTNYLGGWYPAPKQISFEDQKNEENTNLICSDPQHNFHLLLSKSTVKAEFRLMAKLSMDFHVLASLWILKVGHKYDEKLSNHAYGNRLRRKAEGSGINTLSLGSFAPYIKPFRDWRDNGIDTMYSALDEKKSIVALTADVKSFYHELNPQFLLSPDFLNIINLTLDEEEKYLTKLFVESLINWAKSTPLKKGLPVGLPASAIVANMALIELDRVIQKEIVPLYYGRYVDDILLVMENGSTFNSAEDIWEWVFIRSKTLLHWENDNKKTIVYTPEYLSDSKIVFEKSKTKAFLLKGDSGKALVDSLKRQIHERASEWRALPNLPSNPDHIATDLLSAVQSDGENADNLRKADSLSMRRSGFALKLRDFEAYERDLHPEAWSNHRHAFLRAFTDHVLVLPSFFELATYLPRVIRLAVACEDFFELKRMIDHLDELTNVVYENSEVAIKSCENSNQPEKHEIINLWRETISKILDENIKAAFPLRMHKDKKKLWNDLFSNISNFTLTTDIEDIRNCTRRLFNHDLAHTPFRYIGLPKELIRSKNFPSKKNITCFKEAKAFLPSPVYEGLKVISKELQFSSSDLPFGLIFATRPYSLTEIYLLFKTPYHSSVQERIVSSVLALRGFSPEGNMPLEISKDILEIDNQDTSDKKLIAVASWKTKFESWTASVTGDEDPDRSRYRRLNRLLNEVLKHDIKPNYLILPELSIPAQWFMRIAHKLQGKGISLVCGIEYLHRTKKQVSNQVWAALSHDGLGFPSFVIYRQDKQSPAIHEESELFNIAGLTMKPLLKWTNPPIVKHGDFYFSMLICSELTNIAYRADLRGKIDALFVPEWNQDTESFNALVESAALDIHAYIIQCNDREYGDSRIRAPYKDPWKRDLVRIKGGKNDYYVIGEIDIKSLREFQSCHRSPDKPYKPVPDGFKIDFDRKTMPKGEIK